MNKFVIFCSGICAGVIGVKLYPKTKAVKYSKFAIEVFRAYRRLQKILVEEYWRIEEAIDLEQTFLNIIAPDDSTNVTFSILDEEGQRRIHVNVEKDSNAAE